MKILITGGAGFVGSHLCEALIEDHKVICLDNFSTGNLWNIRHLLDSKNFKLVKGDIRDSASMIEVARGVDVIIHLAAQVHVDRSYIEPVFTWKTNVAGTQNMLEAARLNDVSHFIFASTSEVYGSAQYCPMDENHPLLAEHPYGASKIAADRLCYSYARTFNMNITITRCFNIFGPRQRDQGYGGVIGIFARRLYNAQPLLVYGDGKQERDYTYVSDIVAGYKLLLMRGHEAGIGPYNFCHGISHSINSIAEKMKMGFFRDADVYYLPERKNEVAKLLGSYKKAETELGWTPQVSFEDGLKKYLNWYRIYGMESRLVT